jgi:hypothetical protein
VDKIWPQIVERFNSFVESLSEHYVLKIRYEELHEEKTCINIWNFATSELPWDSQRWEMLSKLDVQANVEKGETKCPVMSSGKPSALPTSGL